MQKVSFVCDWCGDTKAHEELIGLQWAGYGLDKTKLEVKDIRDVHKHVCIKCGKALKSILADRIELL